MHMEKAFETESYVSVDAAWHQALSFDEPCPVKVVIENLGEDPIYGFYLDEADFNAMIEHGSVDETVMARIEKQQLCVNEHGVAESEVLFRAGKYYVCVELDVESSPQAKRSEFKLVLYEK